MTTERHEPAVDADERTMLEGWLEYHRQTLAWKCEGLTDEQLRTAAVAPSTLSLMGLVRHMAEVERSWYRRVLAAETRARSTTPTRPGRRVPAHRGGHLRRGPRHLAGRDRGGPPQRGRRPPGRTDPGQAPAHRRALHPALDPHPHDRGVRASQRARGPDPRTPGRRHGRLTSPRVAHGTPYGGGDHPCGATCACPAPVVTPEPAEWRGCIERRPPQRFS